MKRIALAASLVLALASTAFAQDTPPPTDPASSSSDQSAPADSQPATTDDSQSAASQQPAPAPKRHHRRRVAQQGGQQYNPAAEALTGNEPKDVAYQYSDRVKQYPAVDHGHVSGDPPVIDHSSDQAPVPNPTHATIAVPPGH